MARKSIGIPVDPPKQECQDKNCAWHGSLSVRGRTFQVFARSSKARDTVMVEWGYTQLVPKYERYERRRSRVVAHSPECLKARDGDSVIIAECRPLSKTKSFVVVAVPKRKVEQAEFKVADIEEEAVSKARASGKNLQEAKPEKSEKPKEEKPKPAEKEKPKQ
jgi:small subunit ribosomal protein S17